VWNYRESDNKIHTYVWLKHWDYVIVLEKHLQERGMITFLVTAFHVDWESTRKGLHRKFENRET
jgi:hypothetical protein